MIYKFPLLPIVSDADEARSVAIAWQSWASERALSTSELVEWQAYFTELGEKYKLIEEFTENAIL